MRYLNRMVRFYVRRHLVKQCLFTCYELFIIATCSSSSHVKVLFMTRICVFYDECKRR